MAQPLQPETNILNVVPRSIYLSQVLIFIQYFYRADHIPRNVYLCQHDPIDILQEKQILQVEVLKLEGGLFLYYLNSDDFHSSIFTISNIIITFALQYVNKVVLSLHYFTLNHLTICERLVSSQFTVSLLSTRTLEATFILTRYAAIMNISLG